MRKGPSHSKPEERLRLLAKSMREETDRGCALIAGAMFSHLLESILRRYFVGDQKRVDELFKEQGVLGTFGARRQLAFCLGMTTRQVDTNLRVVGKIRNYFAHDLKSASFKDEQIRGYLSSMTKITWEGMPAITLGMSNPKAQFVANVAILFGILEVSLERLNEYTPPKPGMRYGEILSLR